MVLIEFSTERHDDRLRHALERQRLRTLKEERKPRGERFSWLGRIFAGRRRFRARRTPA